MKKKNIIIIYMLCILLAGCASTNTNDDTTKNIQSEQAPMIANEDTTKVMPSEPGHTITNEDTTNNITSEDTSIFKREDKTSHLALARLLPNGSQIDELIQNDDNTAGIFFHYMGLPYFLRIETILNFISVGTVFEANSDLPPSCYYDVCNQLNKFNDVFVQVYFDVTDYAIWFEYNMPIPKTGLNYDFVKNSLAEILASASNAYVALDDIEYLGY